MHICNIHYLILTKDMFINIFFFLLIRSLSTVPVLYVNLHNCCLGKQILLQTLRSVLFQVLEKQMYLQN